MIKIKIFTTFNQEATFVDEVIADGNKIIRITNSDGEKLPIDSFAGQLLRTTEGYALFLKGGKIFTIFDKELVKKLYHNLDVIKDVDSFDKIKTILFML